MTLNIMKQILLRHLGKIDISYLARMQCVVIVCLLSEGQSAVK